MRNVCPDFTVKDLAFVRRTLRRRGIKVSAVFHFQLDDEPGDSDCTIWIDGIRFCMRIVYVETMQMPVIYVDGDRFEEHRFAKLESAIHFITLEIEAGTCPAIAKP